MEHMGELDADFLLQVCAAESVSVCIYYVREDVWIGVEQREVVLDVLRGMQVEGGVKGGRRAWTVGNY